MILNEQHKQDLKAEIEKHWLFRNEPLLHDIPIPILDIKSGEKSIEIPKENLSSIDFALLDEFIQSFKSKFYIINEENEAFYTTHINTSYLINSTIIDSNFEWIICTSVVFENLGHSYIFGGKELIKSAKLLFQDKKEWFTEI